MNTDCHEKAIQVYLADYKLQKSIENINTYESGKKAAEEERLRREAEQRKREEEERNRVAQEIPQEIPQEEPNAVEKVEEPIINPVVTDSGCRIFIKDSSRADDVICFLLENDIYFERE